MARRDGTHVGTAADGTGRQWGHARPQVQEDAGEATELRWSCCYERLPRARLQGRWRQVRCYRRQRWRLAGRRVGLWQSPRQASRWDVWCAAKGWRPIWANWCCERASAGAALRAVSESAVVPAPAAAGAGAMQRTVAKPPTSRAAGALMDCVSWMAEGAVDDPSCSMLPGRGANDGDGGRGAISGWGGGY